MQQDNQTTLATISTGEIVLYQPNESVKLEVRLEDETVWLMQSQMAELFSVNVPAVSKHIKSIFEEGELDVFSTVSKKEIVRKECPCGSKLGVRWGTICTPTRMMLEV